MMWIFYFMIGAIAAYFAWLVCELFETSRTVKAVSMALLFFSWPVWIGLFVLIWVILKLEPIKKH